MKAEFPEHFYKLPMVKEDLSAFFNTKGSRGLFMHWDYLIFYVIFTI